jgi:hypothetical protein
MWLRGVQGVSGSFREDGVSEKDDDCRVDSIPI